MKSVTKLLTAGLALLWLAGCGGVSQEATLMSKPRVNQSASQWDLGRPKGNASERAAGRSVCDRAIVARGPRPGELNFVVRCLGVRKGGVIDLVVVRHPPGAESQRARIVGYGHTLQVVGPGAASHRGVCSLRHQALECSAKAHGHVEFEGILWVPPSTECNNNVAVVNITVASCEGEICEGSPVLHELYLGRPRGCSNS